MKVIFKILGIFGYRIVTVSKGSVVFVIDGTVANVKYGNQWKIVKIGHSAMINTRGRLISKRYEPNDSRDNVILINQIT